ncbi:MAG: polysaccharide deacetylase family protein [Anaerolineae bacterium]|nr:polysaccharide deacetylase family protein [Anaerolineae bacterium]
MPRGTPQRNRWLALGVTLAGLLAMGTVALYPRAASPRAAASRAGTTASSRATLPLVAAWETAARSPTPSPSITPTPTETQAPPATLPPTPSPTETPPPLPLPTPDGQARTARVPILMYHYVGELPADADPVRLDLTVPPDRFEAQLAYLQASGYTSVTLEDLVLYLTVGRPLPEKPIILTFDDGYVDNFIYAFPLLRRYGFTGTFFVVVQFMDEGRAGYITWEQARLMQENGMDIQSHGVSHEDLAGAPAAFVAEQVSASRRRIEEELGKPVRFFAYPYGSYDRRTVAALVAAEYWGAVTTRGGALHSSGRLFELTRVRVHGYHELDRFVATLDYY